MTTTASAFLADILRSLDLDTAPPSLPDGPSLASVLAVSDLAQASVGAAGAALAGLLSAATGAAPPAVRVDRALASAWFVGSIHPDGWPLPPAWDTVAGDYPAADGWIRLHTNAPHHRAVALAVLGVPAERDRVAAAVRAWAADDLEAAVVGAGGAAATMRPCEAWDRHPQGAAVAAEPLVASERTQGDGPGLPVPDPARPLAGVRVLDLTRVIAGPVATRFLAGYGAEVLRIDAPDWDEPAVVPEMTLGKRCARLDLRTGTGRDRLLELLAGADVLVHGYRADALERLGLGADVRRACRPGLVDVSLDAYGWTGPWATRRGFDSLVQMSSGIAATGMDAAGADHPVPLPVQALDHATGYLLAAAAVRGLTLRLTDGAGSRWRTSLARTARLLVDGGRRSGPDGLDGPGLGRVELDEGAPVEATAWGPARRLTAPLDVDGAPLRWTVPAGPLGAAPPAWT